MPRSHRWWLWLEPAPVPAPEPVAKPVAASLRAAREPVWIAIPAQRVVTGLTDAQVHALAETCARATLAWANADPDASLRDVDQAERFGGNAAYLAPLIRDAFPRVWSSSARSRSLRLR